jgi:transcription termination factor Rho
VTETIESTPAESSSNGGPKKRSGGLNSLLLADLKSLAGGLGIRGAGSMKKAQLVDAIKAAQAGGQSGEQSAEARSGRSARAERPAGDDRPAEPERTTEPERPAEQARSREERPAEQEERTSQRERREEQPKAATQTPDSPEQGQRLQRQDRQNQGQQQQDRQQQDRQQQDRQQQDRQNQGQQNQGQGGGGKDQNRQGNRDQGQNREQNQSQNRDQNQGRAQHNQSQDQDYDEGGSRRSRRRRGRDRTSTRQPAAAAGQRNEPDTTILEDDVLIPAAGILDVLDNYAFVRTSGYLPGTDDVYVSLSMIRKFGLRRGVALVGQVRQPREGERKEKFNPMVRIDSVNGADPEASRHRVEFAKLTPLYPSERLRLETEPTNLIGRVIDIASPIGKGQRGLIVSPSKAGKTMIMQSIASSITTNNPECHLMVVLVDERPEEVTDFERSTKGEVISSTFDRPASDHTMVAELAIERAKRLVELGHDVVVLLDGITRLGRAYNLAAPASGRILSGGVDSAALYPPKRFFGAARNIENGGSLTILATALIESGSKMDEVIFEEFKGTGNMELRLRRDFADKRLFPAIDAVQSGTRREELLMSKEELAIVWKLRRVLSGLDGQQALELLLERLKKSQSNIEFLMQVQKTTPGAMGGTD